MSNVPLIMFIFQIEFSFIASHWLPISEESQWVSVKMKTSPPGLMRLSQNQTITLTFKIYLDIQTTICCIHKKRFFEALCRRINKQSLSTQHGGRWTRYVNISWLWKVIRDDEWVIYTNVGNINHITARWGKEISKWESYATGHK